jgi:2-amino-4-hydroxy-6-hydroxymethyldihydropteridine diphosphokinase
MPNICAIAIGSNLGDSLQIVNAALADLDTISTIQVIRRSPWYRTKAITQNMATTESLQPDYINGCAILSTTLTPTALLAVLLDVEMQFGRIRREKWDARTLDLDLLLYENYVLDTPNLIIPHPRMCDRAFVLLPLAQIAPDWIHPIKGEAIAALAIHPPDIELSCPQLITI